MTQYVPSPPKIQICMQNLLNIGRLLFNKFSRDKTLSISNSEGLFSQNGFQTRGPAESWRDLFDYFNIDYFKIVLKFQVSQVDSALPTQKK